MHMSTTVGHCVNGSLFNFPVSDDWLALTNWPAFTKKKTLFTLHAIDNFYQNINFHNYSSSTKQCFDVNLTFSCKSWLK